MTTKLDPADRVMSCGECGLVETHVDEGRDGDAYDTVRPHYWDGERVELLLETGTRVAIWAGARLSFLYPEQGLVAQYIADYPGGPVYEVRFDEGDIPFACLPREWLFPVRAQ